MLKLRHKIGAKCKVMFHSAKIQKLSENSVFHKLYFIMVYCLVPCCTNGNHNGHDLSYFVFPCDKRLRIWLKFFHRVDKFSVEANKVKSGMPNSLRICSTHSVPE